MGAIVKDVPARCEGENDRRCGGQRRYQLLGCLRGCRRRLRRLAGEGDERIVVPAALFQRNPTSRAGAHQQGDRSGQAGKAARGWSSFGGRHGPPWRLRRGALDVELRVDFVRQSGQSRGERGAAARSGVTRPVQRIEQRVQSDVLASVGGEPRRFVRSGGEIGLDGRAPAAVELAVDVGLQLVLADGAAAIAEAGIGSVRINTHGTSLHLS